MTAVLIDEANPDSAASPRARVAAFIDDAPDSETGPVGSPRSEEAKFWPAVPNARPSLFNRNVAAPDPGSSIGPSPKRRIQAAETSSAGPKQTIAILILVDDNGPARGARFVCEETLAEAELFS
jgi:hypothetical protein